MTLPPSLGKMLAQQLVSPAAAAVPQSAEDLSAAHEREERLVETFFTNAKSQLKHDILAGRRPSLICVGNGENLEVARILDTNRDALPVSSRAHRMHFYWLDFERWAADNDLVPLWHLQNDFAQGRAWYELSVKPL